MPRMTRFADELSSCRFPASVADWTRRGIPRTTLTGPRFTRTAYGWYRRAGPPRSTAQRILDALAGQVDGALIAGWAAAYVHGVDLLDGLDDHTMAPLPVPVLLPPGQRRRSTRHIQYRQSRGPAHQERIERVPVTTLFRAALDLALLAPELTEAVVALDAVLASRLLAHQRLQRVAADLPRRRGVRQARRAIELARIGVRSPWESRLRMFAETSSRGRTCSRTVLSSTTGAISSAFPICSTSKQASCSSTTEPAGGLSAAPVTAISRSTARTTSGRNGWSGPASSWYVWRRPI
jgi:hypothetical protein